MASRSSADRLSPRQICSVVRYHGGSCYLPRCAASLSKSSASASIADILCCHGSVSSSSLKSPWSMSLRSSIASSWRSPSSHPRSSEPSESDSASVGLADDRPAEAPYPRFLVEGLVDSAQWVVIMRVVWIVGCVVDWKSDWHIDVHCFRRRRHV